MNEANTQKLYADFPRLYRNATDPQSTMKYGFCCNDGWFELIYKLSANVETEAHRLGLHPDSDGWPCVLQVKEKFGTLAFYCQTGDEARLEAKAVGEMLSFRPVPNIQSIRAIIREAEEESASICEDCGSPAEMRDEEWLRVTCDKCESIRVQKRAELIRRAES